MSRAIPAVEIGGLLKADGTLELDHRPDLPAGRVIVVLRPSVDVDLPTNDPFWDRMKAMWAIPVGNADGGARTLDEVHRMREEWEPDSERK